MRAALIGTPAILLLAIGCAHAPPRETGPRFGVMIMSIDDSGGPTTRNPEGNEASYRDVAGIRSAFEEALIKRNVAVATIADGGEASMTPTHYGIAIHIQENVNLLTALTLGVIPYTAYATARVVDLHSGEVKAAVHAQAWASIYSSGGLYRAVRKLADQIADVFLETQDTPNRRIE